MVAPVSTSSAAATTTGTQSQTHTLSARVRKTIQSIKEIVGNFSDADIYIALKETNMDPNETAQKLLNQGQFFITCFANGLLAFSFGFLVAFQMMVDWCSCAHLFKVLKQEGLWGLSGVWNGLATSLNIGIFHAVVFLALFLVFLGVLSNGNL